jgi:hypothetical protein
VVVNENVELASLFGLLLLMSSIAKGELLGSRKNDENALMLESFGAAQQLQLSFGCNLKSSKKMLPTNFDTKSPAHFPLYF